MGPDGGKVVLPQEPRLRATFPKNALYKKIKVGLQVQSLRPELVQAAFGRSVEVSKMIALEPRKRKFHQPIFMSIPLPCNPSKINENTNIRLLCSGKIYFSLRLQKGLEDISLYIILIIDYFIEINA